MYYIIKMATEYTKTIQSTVTWANESWKGHVWVKCNDKRPADVWWESLSDVNAVWSTMGDWDYHVWLEVENPDAMETFVKENLISQDWVCDTRSSWNKQLGASPMTTDWYGTVWVKFNTGFDNTWTWADHKQVSSLWSTMGKWDACFWVNANTPEEMDTFVNGWLTKFPWVKETSTSWSKSVWQAPK